MPSDLSFLQTPSLLSYILVFLGGLTTSLGPCNISMIPLMIAFVGGKKDPSQSRAMQLSGVFVIGLATTYMTLGVFASMVGRFIGGNSHMWYYLVAAVCIVLGLQMLGVITMPQSQVLGRIREKINQKGLTGAFFLGLISGLVASQCATPVLAAIVTYVLAIKAKIIYGAVLLFVYALGRGIPIFLAGTFTGMVKKFQKLAAWSEWIENVSGIIMIIIGFYFIWIA